jgi:hypothetical protein
LLLFAVACKPGTRDVPRELAPAPSGKVYASVVNTPEKLSSIETGRRDSHGKPVRVACDECHSQLGPQPIPERASELRDFHRGLSFEHGDLACKSCHAGGDHALLKLASGEGVAMQNALRLCAQCHGPQYRDYRRGAHGGMSGYWDLSRGPRARNNCVDCHDPHSPAFPSVKPAPPPRDRIAPASKHGEHS